MQRGGSEEAAWRQRGGSVEAARSSRLELPMDSRSADSDYFDALMGARVGLACQKKGEVGGCAASSSFIPGSSSGMRAARAIDACA
jgi:hypothetical protein